jgi:hypothetical protein
MGLKEILNQIDTEISQLERARFLLAGDKPKRGRKKGSVNLKPAKKRTMSAESRKRIADAAKRRWAEKRKAAAGK